MGTSETRLVATIRASYLRFVLPALVGSVVGFVLFVSADDVSWFRRGVFGIVGVIALAASVGASTLRVVVTPEGTRVRYGWRTVDVDPTRHHVAFKTHRYGRGTQRVCDVHESNTGDWVLTIPLYVLTPSDRRAVVRALSRSGPS